MSKPEASETVSPCPGCPDCNPAIKGETAKSIAWWLVSELLRVDSIYLASAKAEQITERIDAALKAEFQRGSEDMFEDLMDATAAELEARTKLEKAEAEVGETRGLLLAEIEAREKSRAEVKRLRGLFVALDQEFGQLDWSDAPAPLRRAKSILWGVLEEVWGRPDDE